MSRIGKLPIKVPKGVTVNVTPSEVSVKGPKGELKVPYHSRLEIKLENGELVLRRFDDSRPSKAFHGLYQRLISNSIQGVTEGYKKELEIQGVGYRAAVQGKTLVLALGYSHEIKVEPPKGVSFAAPKQTEVIVEGIDKQQVGQLAANIRSLRPPEPYKGKGIRYKGEYVARKEGKTSGK